MISGDACAGTTTRTITFSQGECQINQIALNPSGSVLYAAAGNIVRMFDLNRYVCPGRSLLQKQVINGSAYSLVVSLMYEFGLQNHDWSIHILYVAECEKKD